MRKINKKMAAAAIGLLAVAAVGCAAGYHRLAEGKEETAARETQAVYGLLTVGIQKDGAVSVGTLQQTFSLDLSAYTETGTDSFPGCRMLLFFREWAVGAEVPHRVEALREV